MSGTSPGPTKLRMARPKSVNRQLLSTVTSLHLRGPRNGPRTSPIADNRLRYSFSSALADELALRVEHAQDGQLLVGRRLRGGEGRAQQHLEAGVLAHLLHRRAGVQGQELHAAALRVEAEEAERGDHAGDATEEQAGAPS